MVYNPYIIDCVLSVLTNLPDTYYPKDYFKNEQILDLMNGLRKSILSIFARIVTPKESASEYMDKVYLGNLIYDNFIVTAPIIFDLCRQYSRDNFRVVKKIVHTIFSLQIEYNYDTRKIIEYFLQVRQDSVICQKFVSHTFFFSYKSYCEKQIPNSTLWPSEWLRRLWEES